MGSFYDIKNQKFGRLYVIEKHSKEKNGEWKWLCLCDCGKYVVVRGRELRNNRTKSCGCYCREIHIKHGQYGTRIYHIWCSMKKRCTDTKHKSYKNYGGRGIQICNEWANDFTNFYNWAIANGYQDDLTLDRINNDGNYEPTNCRWTTMKEQENHRRNNVCLTYNGETLTISEWANKLNIKHSTLLSRMKRGYEIEEILFKPVNKTKLRGKKYEYK